MSLNHSPRIYELGPEFYDHVTAADFQNSTLRFRNNDAASLVNLEKLSAAEWTQRFADFKSWSENIKDPLALRYHGHQFQVYNPDIGDGRGFLFAQFYNSQNQKLYDLGTKGSGTTPYSRRGDGRLTLKGAFREALATEMLETLGVNTSKTLSIFETDERLSRNDEPSPTRAAVLVRLSEGHIRIGTFQRYFYFQEKENLEKLLRYSVKQYYPGLEAPDLLQQIELFFNEVLKRNAKLVAQVMMAGFVHGVLNTDNINVAGELFDFGPYRFLPNYNPEFTAAYFDQQGLYAYGRQPHNFLWNLNELAKTLKFLEPKFNPEPFLESFSDFFNEAASEAFLKRLNLKSKNEIRESQLLTATFDFLDKSKIPFEQAFFDLYGGLDRMKWQSSPDENLYLISEFKVVEKLLNHFEIANPELLKHPYLQNDRPESLIIDEIESLWSSIDKNDDWSPFNKKIAAIKSYRGLY